MTRQAKLNEATAIIKNSKSQLSQIDKLKISITDRNNFQLELAAVYESLELLRIKLENMR